MGARDRDSCDTRVSITPAFRNINKVRKNELQVHQPQITVQELSRADKDVTTEKTD